MASINYRELKRRLNQYHTFSFKMPRKGQDFTPQQKSAIRRVYNRIAPALKSVNKGTNGWLKISKNNLKKIGENFDYRVKTNKGVFTKFPDPKLYKSKKKGLYVGTHFGRRREIFFPFPRWVVTMDDIIIHVGELKKLHGEPDYIRWSVNGYQGSALYDPEVFSLYATEYGQDIEDEKEDTDKFFFNGVFFGYAPDDLK